MQTFLPYADFHETARVLDDKRLGNQAYNECKVIINQLRFAPDGMISPKTGKFTPGWSRHPAVKMWRGNICSLAHYALALLEELDRRGKPYPHWVDFYNDICDECCGEHDSPIWLGDESVHASHRANLLRKDPEWYGQFGWTEEPVEGYVWPA